MLVFPSCHLGPQNVLWGKVRTKFLKLSYSFALPGEYAGGEPAVLFRVFSGTADCGPVADEPSRAGYHVVPDKVGWHFAIGGLVPVYQVKQFVEECLFLLHDVCLFLFRLRVAEYFPNLFGRTLGGFGGLEVVALLVMQDVYAPFGVERGAYAKVIRDEEVLSPVVRPPTRQVLKLLLIRIPALPFLGQSVE